MLSSPVEWGIVAAVALVFFGPKKFPELGRSLGQGIGNFKKALTDAQDEVSAGIKDVESDDAEEADSDEQSSSKKTTSKVSRPPAK